MRQLIVVFFSIQFHAIRNGLALVLDHNFALFEIANRRISVEQLLKSWLIDVGMASVGSSHSTGIHNRRTYDRKVAADLDYVDFTVIDPDTKSYLF